MTILPGEAEQEFQHALRRFFADTVTQEYRRARIDQEQAGDPEFTGGLKALGLFEYFSEPTSATSGGHARELLITAFEAGRALVPQAVSEVLLAGPCVVSELMAAGLQPPFYEEDLKQIVSGQQTVAGLLLPEVHGLEVSESTVGGSQSFVPAGCDHVLLLFPGECSRAIIVKYGEEVSFVPEQSLDLTIKRVKLTFKSAPGTVIAGEVADRICALFSLALCAQAAGLCQRVVEITSEYVSVRKQFGVPVGGFQAVQHGLADMYAFTEAMRAVTFFGGWSAEESPNQLLLATLSAARYVIEKAPWVVEKAIQLHGGMGFTWEHDLHLFLRRARLLAWQLGSLRQCNLTQVAENQL